MKRVLPLEFVGYEKLEYNLYNENGDLICEKGENFTPNLLIKLNHMILYRHEEIQTKNINITTGISGQTLPAPPVSVIKEGVKTGLLNNTRKLLQKVYDGESVKLDECEASSKIILEEVSASLEGIRHIEQLRVYDEYTYSHNINVSSLSIALGFSLNLEENELKELALGAFLHDIGKMKIPKEVLNKPDKLEIQEREIIKRHTSLGYRYIKEKFEVPDRIARVALDHHEKYGGKGYPNGLHGKLINNYAQITNIVDVYDALLSDRVYKKGHSNTKTLEIMESAFKTDFNPVFYSKFLELTDAEALRKKS